MPKIYKGKTPPRRMRLPDYVTSSRAKRSGKDRKAEHRKAESARRDSARDRDEA